MNYKFPNILLGYVIISCVLLQQVYILYISTEKDEHIQVNLTKILNIDLGRCSFKSKEVISSIRKIKTRS